MTMTTAQTSATDSSGDRISDSPVAAAGSLGHRLSELRKERGLSILDVAQVIKYSPRQIEALECDQFDQLPDAAIIRGFIRNYARLLQVDATDLLSTFNRQVPTATFTGGIEVPPTTGARLPQTGWGNEPWRLMIPGGVFIVLLIVAVAYFLWPATSQSTSISSKDSGVDVAVAATVPPESASSSNDMRSQTNTDAQGSLNASSALQTVKTPAQKSDLTEKDPAVKAQPSSPSASSVSPAVKDPELRQLMFSFDDKSWVEVKDATKRTIFAQSNPPGTHQVVNGKPPFTVVVGNAPRVQLHYEERLIDMQPYTQVDVARFTLK